MSRNAHKKRVKAIIESAPLKYRDWLQDTLGFSNQKKLSKKIDEVLDSNRNEAARLTANIDDFAAKVRHSRNYYTHYGKKTVKVAKGLELRRIMYALYGLLQVCLLKELGIKGKPIERILKRNSLVKWEDLELAHHAAKTKLQKQSAH